MLVELELYIVTPIGVEYAFVDVVLTEANVESVAPLNILDQQTGKLGVTDVLKFSIKAVEGKQAVKKLSILLHILTLPDPQFDLTQTKYFVDGVNEAKL